MTLIVKKDFILLHKYKVHHEIMNNACNINGHKIGIIEFVQIYGTSEIKHIQ